jgi:dCMP deaminase
MRNRPDKWDVHFMRLAREASFMSKDPSTQIGAVLVKDRRVVGTGFNGFPPGVADDERLHDREEKYELVVHGEMNAILQAGRDAKGATLYMFGFKSPPCRNCTKHSIAAGIVRVVGCGIPTPGRWQPNLEAAGATLAEAGVGITYLELGDLDS